MARVKWNETNLAEIEANKPERQKITEPKTPYHPMIDDDDDDISSPARGGNFEHHYEEAMQAEAIRSALNVADSSNKNDSHHSGWTSSEDDQDEGGLDSERHRSFREHRTAHYDEFRKVKELRGKGSLMEDDFDEEAGNGKKDEGCASSSSSSITTGVKDIHIKESSKTANGS